MTIRYYVHAWQGLLMFLAGLVSVLAAFAGYIQSGGGEELLRRALSSVTQGRAQFDSFNFKWKAGEIVVTNLRHDDFGWPQEDPLVKCSGLLAKELTIKLDLFPWPPAVESITVRGMPDTTIAVSEGFLQDPRWQRRIANSDVRAIRFVDCDVSLTIGKVGPLQLTGCGGELRRGNATETPRGAFSLHELNGKPFNFKLETLEAGRWVFTGEGLQLDTREIKATGNPFAGQLDPVGLLVTALFSGEMAASGIVSSLRLTVQPASGANKFVCDGEVGYSNLEFRLPKPTADAGQALPFWLDRLLGAGENLWPRWMQVDSIKTGAGGRVTFHMDDGKLNFACDEGLGSAFTGTKDGQVFPPLEALKGAVETDSENRPKNIVLRGFLGNELSFETRIANNADRSRAYDLLLEPRPQPPQPAAKAEVRGRAARPLWRFASNLTDYFDVPPAQRPMETGQRNLVAFEVEGEARHFPWPDWLPPGMRDLSGHMYVKGRFTDSQRLRLETVNWDDGAALSYGGEPAAPQRAAAVTGFGPLWQALYALFGTGTPWELQNVSIRGHANVQFSPNLLWQTTELDDFMLTSGSLSYAGLTTDLSIVKPVLAAIHRREADMSDIGLSAAVSGKWKTRLHGAWRPDEGVGTFKLLEEDVPFALHPQRGTLAAPYRSPDERRVNRKTTVRINGADVKYEMQP